MGSWKVPVSDLPSWQCQQLAIETMLPEIASFPHIHGKRTCASSLRYALIEHSPGALEVRPDLPCSGWVPRAPVYDTPEMSCWEVDMINNFFLARTDFLRKVRWDPRLKLGEHEDFYLRVQQQKGRVGLCRGATAVNDNSCDASPLYKAKRGRVFDYWITFFQKHGLHEMRTAAGRYILQCGDDAAAAGAEKGAAGAAAGGGAAEPHTGIETRAEDHDGEAVSQAGDAAARPRKPGKPKCRIEVQQDAIWFNT